MSARQEENTRVPAPRPGVVVLNRADGSVVTRHRNLWTITHDAGRWGTKQRSC